MPLSERTYANIATDNPVNAAKVVIVECDYKGSYYRYALTQDEFRKEYTDVRSDMPEPDEDAQSFTTRPMVHIWYKLCGIRSDEFSTFFTDMTWGLCQSDIDNNNLAVVNLDECKSLRKYVNDITRNTK